MVSENVLQPPADWNNVTYTAVANPAYMDAERTAISMMVVFNHIGPDPIPFTAMPTDEYPHGRELYARAAAGDFGPVAAYVPPPPYIPQSVTRRQGRLALLEVGKLDAAEAAITAIVDPTERRAAQIEYEADTWERGNAFLQAMWTLLGGTEGELDALFQLAAAK